MKKYTLWIIIAVLVVSAAVTAYAMRDEPASEHDDANVPRTVEVKDKQGEETTNRLLSDIGTWSVKSCLVLDGEEYDLYATFDDPEKAIENVKGKCLDALTKLRRGSLTLGELSDGNWQRYRDALAATSDGDNEQSDTLAAFFDIYENEDKNAQIIKLAEIKANPTLAKLDCVKNERFATITLESVLPGDRIAYAVETLAKAFYPDMFE